VKKSKVYTVGSDQDSDVLLPKKISKKIAILTTNDQNKIEMKLLEETNDLDISIDKEKLQQNKTYILNDDEDPKPTNVSLENTCIFFVIKRSRGLAIRIKDSESENRKNFGHRIWFPYDPKWVIKAKWVPDEIMLNVPFANESGQKTECKSLGYAEFEIEEHKIQFRPIMDGEKLQFIFKDKTSGKLTYGCRFIFVDVPTGNEITINFNRAVNPPCAITEFAVCPFPIEQNRFGFELKAGEKFNFDSHY